jgi:hypothetical protein
MHRAAHTEAKSIFIADRRDIVGIVHPCILQSEWHDVQHTSPFFQICFEATRSGPMSVTLFMVELTATPLRRLTPSAHRTHHIPSFRLYWYLRCATVSSICRISGTDTQDPGVLSEVIIADVGGFGKNVRSQ